jgi:hypothetical protein
MHRVLIVGANVESEARQRALAQADFPDKVGQHVAVAACHYIGTGYQVTLEQLYIEPAYKVRDMVSHAEQVSAEYGFETSVTYVDSAYELFQTPKLHVDVVWRPRWDDGLFEVVVVELGQERCTELVCVVVSFAWQAHILAVCLTGRLWAIPTAHMLLSYEELYG